MEDGIYLGWLPGDAAMTWTVTILALFVVWLPFYRGLKLSLQAWNATLRYSSEELKKGTVKGKGSVEPIALLMLSVLKKALVGNESERHPADFIFDATRQYVINEFDDHYTRLISMYASLLPPIGFIGTTGGMLILFISMQMGESSLEFGALAIALTSSIFALIGYSVLEALKIRLYRRLLMRVRDVQTLYREADSRRQQPRPAGVSATGPVAVGAQRA
jgi:hypothetical protein